MVANVLLWADLLQNRAQFDGFVAESGQCLLVGTKFIIFKLSTFNHEIDFRQAVLKAGTGVTFGSGIANVIEMSNSDLLTNKQVEVVGKGFVTV